MVHDHTFKMNPKGLWAELSGFSLPQQGIG